MRKGAKKRATRKSPNNLPPVTLDDALAEIVGSKILPRCEVTKRIWDYVKQRDLSRGKIIHCDDRLFNVFGLKSFHGITELQRLLNNHIISKKSSVDSTPRANGLCASCTTINSITPLKEIKYTKIDTRGLPIAPIPQKDDEGVRRWKELEQALSLAQGCEVYGPYRSESNKVPSRDRYSRILQGDSFEKQSENRRGAPLAISEKVAGGVPERVAPTTTLERVAPATTKQRAAYLILRCIQNTKVELSIKRKSPIAEKQLYVSLHDSVRFISEKNLSPSETKLTFSDLDPNLSYIVHLTESPYDPIGRRVPRDMPEEHRRYFEDILRNVKQEFDEFDYKKWKASIIHSIKIAQRSDLSKWTESDVLAFAHSLNVPVSFICLISFRNLFVAAKNTV